jgi:hypothetical protein
MSLVKTLHTATGNALRRVIVTIYLVFPVEVSLHTMALIVLLSPFALPVLPPTFPSGLSLPFILFSFRFVSFPAMPRWASFAAFAPRLTSGTTPAFPRP